MRSIFPLAILAVLISCCSCFHSATSKGLVQGTGGAAYEMNAPELGALDVEEPVYIDRDFDPQERSAIHAALADWNMVLNGYLHFKIIKEDVDYSNYIVLLEMRESMQGLAFVKRDVGEVEVQLEDPRTLAWTNGVGGDQIHVIGQRVGVRNLRVILEHEIGHSLGVDHLPIRGTLMYPGYSGGADCIDRVTVQTLAGRRGWDWHHMNYCPRPF